VAGGNSREYVVSKGATFEQALLTA